MDIKFINLCHCKTLQNLPDWDFWLENIPSGKPCCFSRTGYTFVAKPSQSFIWFSPFLRIMVLKFSCNWREYARRKGLSLTAGLKEREKNGAVIACMYVCMYVCMYKQKA
jgi:hypothetical protein